MPDEVRIATRSPESAEFVAGVERAMAMTARINRLTYADADEVRALFAELIDQRLDDRFRLVPPFYSDHGSNISVGERVFVNQCCTIYDLAQVSIGDDVLIGPNVSLITSEHPVDPSERRAFLVGSPIVIGDRVWIAAGATIIGGVSIGEDAVVAAGSVVTRDVPARTLVAGNPAQTVRNLAG